MSLLVQPLRLIHIIYYVLDTIIQILQIRKKKSNATNLRCHVVRRTLYRCGQRLVHLNTRKQSFKMGHCKYHKYFTRQSQTSNSIYQHAFHKCSIASYYNIEEMLTTNRQQYQSFVLQFLVARSPKMKCGLSPCCVNYQLNVELALYKDIKVCNDIEPTLIIGPLHFEIVQLQCVYVPLIILNLSHTQKKVKK